MKTCSPLCCYIQHCTPVCSNLQGYCCHCSYPNIVYLALPKLCRSELQLIGLSGFAIAIFRCYFAVPAAGCHLILPVACSNTCWQFLSGSYRSSSSSKHFLHMGLQRHCTLSVSQVIRLVRRFAAGSYEFAICLRKALASALCRREANAHSPRPDCSSTDLITTCVACTCTVRSETEPGKSMHPLLVMLAGFQQEYLLSE